MGAQDAWNENKDCSRIFLRASSKYASSSCSGSRLELDSSRAEGLCAGLCWSNFVIIVLCRSLSCHVSGNSIAGNRSLVRTSILSELVSNGGQHISKNTIYQDEKVSWWHSERRRTYSEGIHISLGMIGVTARTSQDLRGRVQCRANPYEMQVISAHIVSTRLTISNHK